MSPLQRERIAAVLAGSQGTGYLLTPRLVLTAAHVVTGEAPVTAVVPGGTGPLPCRVVWAGAVELCDVALLLAEQDLVEPAVSAHWPAVRWGRIDDLRPRPHCQAIGYPHVQHGGSGQLDSEQLIGTLKPGTSLVRGGFTVDLAHAPPAPRQGGGSPWAGMSGAALFDGDVLVGVVNTDPAGWSHSRLTAVPTTAIHLATGFHDAHLAAAGAPPLLDGEGQRQPAERTGFEREYRSYVARHYNELRIFGLDFSRSDHAQWPLDTAYLSLELSGQRTLPPSDLPGNVPPHELSSGRQRVEAALSGRPRVLLRGLAGSGKTTLVHWLAVTAARDAFGHQLGHLDDCVPFILPLRTLVRRGELPDPAHFLAATGNPLTPPDGWVTDVMRSGRALLLVDGVDEIPESHRARTLTWLHELLSAYPQGNCVVTTRPTAVADGWLARREFVELNLLPMNEQDVDAFVRRWHRAAYADDQDAGTERDQHDAGTERDQYTERLLDTLTRKRDLSRLATNPLMCAMICALHRDRRTYLPENRMDLYSAALTMLLVRRDQERDVGAPELMEIPEEEQRQLLQEFAYWLIRNGQTEADQETAVRLVRRLLPAMPQVASVEQAGDVFRFLLRRSGVLREPTPQTVDFVHRTFQDYLGARAAVDAQDMALVVAHAADPQWEDVIRMAVGHCRPEERAELLHRLLAQGDAADDEETRTRLHLLAAASLEHATRLNPDIRRAAEERASRLVPPQSYADAERLATAGPVVLDLLPEPDQLTEAEAVATVHTVARIGGDQAFHLLRRYRDHPSHQVRSEVAAAWNAFPSDRFVEEFLAVMDLSDVRVSAATLDQLSALDRVSGPVGELELVGSFPAPALAWGLEVLRPERLRLVGNDAVHALDFLAPDVDTLRSLELSDCGSLTDYAQLAELDVERLVLELMPVGPGLAPVAAMTRLTSLSIHSRTPYGALSELPLPPSLEHLVLESAVLDPADLTGIERCPRLTTLVLPPQLSFGCEELHRLAALPELCDLDASLIWGEDLVPGELPVLPQVRRASLRMVTHGDVSFATLCMVFPQLRSLTAAVQNLHICELTVAVGELSALEYADVHIISGAEVRLLGTERLTGQQSVTTTSLSPEPPPVKPPRRLLPWRSR